MRDTSSWPKPSADVTIHLFQYDNCLAGFGRDVSVRRTTMQRYLLPCGCAFSRGCRTASGASSLGAASDGTVFMKPVDAHPVLTFPRLKSITKLLAILQVGSHFRGCRLRLPLAFPLCPSLPLLTQLQLLACTRGIQYWQNGRDALWCLDRWEFNETRA